MYKKLISIASYLADKKLYKEAADIKKLADDLMDHDRPGQDKIKEEAYNLWKDYLPKGDLWIGHSRYPDPDLRHLREGKIYLEKLNDMANGGDGGPSAPGGDVAIDGSWREVVYSGWEDEDFKAVLALISDNDWLIERLENEMDLSYI